MDSKNDRRNNDELGPWPPTVAVIVPCRNERAQIARFLDEVLASDYDHARMKILVADGMSDDGTREILFDYQRRHSIIRVLDNPLRTTARALNIAIRRSNSKVVFRLDVRANYPRDYISRLVRALIEHNADNVGGLRLTQAGANAWSRAVASLVSHRFAVGDAHWRSGSRQPKKVDTVYCGCYRRSVFARVGLFDERMIRIEDREFNFRLAAAGGIILLDPSVRCTYIPRRDLLAYCAWTFSGPYRVFLSRIYTSTPLTSWRNYVPALFLLYHGIPVIAYFAAPRLFPLSLLPIAIYWALNAICSVSEAARYRSWPVAPMLMGGFFLTHVIYGAASIVGAAAAALHGVLSRLRLIEMRARQSAERGPRDAA